MVPSIPMVNDRCMHSGGIGTEHSGHYWYVPGYHRSHTYLFNTYYVITEKEHLILHCGIFPKKEIAISEIEALEPTIFPAFSYALSLNRIIIWKEGKMWMMISPENEKEFIRLLRKINPKIELKKNEGLI